MKKSREDATKKRKKPPTSVKGNGDGNDSEKKRHKKFEKAVAKKAKDIVASAMEAENADDEAFQAKIEAALEKSSKKSEISAASAKKNEDSIETEEANYQKKAKLSSVKLSGIVKRFAKAGSKKKG